MVVGSTVAADVLHPLKTFLVFENEKRREKHICQMLGDYFFLIINRGYVSVLDKGSVV